MALLAYKLESYLEFQSRKYSVEGSLDEIIRIAEDRYDLWLNKAELAERKKRTTWQERLDNISYYFQDLKKEDLSGLDDFNRLNETIACIDYRIKKHYMKSKEDQTRAKWLVSQMKEYRTEQAAKLGIRITREKLKINGISGILSLEERLTKISDLSDRYLDPVINEDYLDRVYKIDYESKYKIRTGKIRDNDKINIINRLRDDMLQKIKQYNIWESETKDDIVTRNHLRLIRNGQTINRRLEEYFAPSKNENKPIEIIYQKGFIGKIKEKISNVIDYYKRSLL